MPSRRNFLTSFIGLGAVSSFASDDRSELLTPSPFSLDHFGIKGDGVTDDTIAMQSALDYCAEHGIGLLLDAGRTYRACGLVLPDCDSLCIYGNGATISPPKTPRSDFVFASGKYVSNLAEAQRPVRIKDLSIIGNSAIKNGIICQSWQSEFHDLTITQCQDSCILFTASTWNGTPFRSSTLVNNRVQGCTLTRSNFGIRVKDVAKNKVTDGFISDCLIYGNETGVSLESSGGWLVSGCHLYSNKRVDMLVDFNWSGFRVVHNYSESNVFLRILDGDGGAIVSRNFHRGTIEAPKDMKGRVFTEGNLNLRGKLVDLVLYTL